ncbi:MAG: helix-turn-helix transcriptional regulator [Balneolales bacterium]
MNKFYPTGPVTDQIRQMTKLHNFRNERLELFETLTERELEILTLVADGQNNPTIAKHLGIKRVTVQNHRTSIREKLNIQNDSDYIKFALAYDLIKF